jgi:hypothetical protein
MVRLDECGKPIWVKKGCFHHSLSQADDGSFWTWRGANGAYAQYQYMVNFDPKNGKTIKEIDLVEDVVKKMKDPSEVFLIRNNFRFRSLKVQYHTRFDLFHPNDVEALPQKYAAAFPMFKPGDLLFSLKMLNLVAVLDPDSKQVKWWSHGPWRWQHDPDFAPDGAISVYNNNADLDRSEIIKIDPATHQARNELAEGDLSFYSRTMGKQQYLPDGNILIVVPGQGRALLVSSTGNKIMEYNNISPDNIKHNLHMENGVWLPPGYFDHIPLCPK